MFDAPLIPLSGRSGSSSGTSRRPVAVGWVIARTSWSSSTHGSSSALRFIGKLLREPPCHRLLRCGLDIEGRQHGVHEVTFAKGFTQSKPEIAASQSLNITEPSRHTLVTCAAT